MGNPIEDNLCSLVGKKMSNINQYLHCETARLRKQVW